MGCTHSFEQETTSQWVACLLCYAIATILQLYHGGDMMYGMRRRKPETKLLLL